MKLEALQVCALPPVLLRVMTSVYSGLLTSPQRPRRNRATSTVYVAGLAEVIAVTTHAAKRAFKTEGINTVGVKGLAPVAVT